jgi:hypothetical protein
MPQQPMGAVQSLSNQLTQMLDYGNPVLDAPPFPEELLAQGGAVGDAMGGMGGMGMDPSVMGMPPMDGSMGGQTPPMDTAMPQMDPMSDPEERNEMMDLLSQRAMQRKDNAMRFQQAAAQSNKSR